MFTQKIDAIQTDILVDINNFKIAAIGSLFNLCNCASVICPTSKTKASDVECEFH